MVPSRGLLPASHIAAMRPPLHPCSAPRRLTAAPSFSALPPCLPALSRPPRLPSQVTPDSSWVSVIGMWFLLVLNLLQAFLGATIAPVYRHYATWSMIAYNCGRRASESPIDIFRSLRPYRP